MVKKHKVSTKTKIKKIAGMIIILVNFIVFSQLPGYVAAESAGHQTPFDGKIVEKLQSWFAGIAKFVKSLVKKHKKPKVPVPSIVKDWERHPT